MWSLLSPDVICYVFVVRFAKHFVTNLPARLAQAVKHLGPVIKERYRLLELYGDNWNEKPVRRRPLLSVVYIQVLPFRTTC